MVIGFTNAAALVISSLQLGKLLGINVESGSHLYNTLWSLLKAIPDQTHLPTLAMGAFSLLLLVLFKKFTPRLPGILLTVVIAILLSWFIGFESMGGEIVAEVNSGLPSFKGPNY